MDILPVKKDDLNVILELQKDCFLVEADLHNDYNIPPLRQDLVSIENDFENFTFLKGVINGEIVGSVRGFVENGTCNVARLIVKKEFQNQGIGRLLMDSIETLFKECDKFELFTGYKSQKNLYFYNKLGYKEFRREKISDSLTLIYLEKINRDGI